MTFLIIDMLSSIESIRKKYLIYDYFYIILLTLICSAILVLIIYFIIKHFLQKKFSFEVKKAIFSFIKSIPELENVEIVKYNPKGEITFETACRKMFPYFSVYKQEDIFDIIANGIDIRFGEVELGYYQGSGKNSKYVMLFRGIIFMIPSDKLNKIVPYQKCQINNYTYIAKPYMNKDLLEFSLFKPFNLETLNNFFSELKEIIRTIT